MMDEPTNIRDGGTGCFKAVSNLEVYAGTHTKGGKSTRTDNHKQVRKIRRFCQHPRWDEHEIYGDASLMEVTQQSHFLSKIKKNWLKLHQFLNCIIF